MKLLNHIIGLGYEIFPSMLCTYVRTYNVDTFKKINLPSAFSTNAKSRPNTNSRKSNLTNVCRTQKSLRKTLITLPGIQTFQLIDFLAQKSLYAFLLRLENKIR